MAKIKDIIAAIEQYAPRYLQEGFDNAGMQVGDAEREAIGALICVDVTESVLDEAIAKGANLIVSHHPLIFRGLKSLTGRNPIERIVAKAIKNDVAIYAAHTNMDSAIGGVSVRMAEKLGLTDVSVLSSRQSSLVKIVVFVPESHAEQVEQSMFACGAGNIGNYDNCSYRTVGEGRFRAKDGATPYVGEIGALHSEKEVRVEVVVDMALKDRVISSMIKAHPYEEPAYDVIQLLNESAHYGLGVVGNVTEMKATEFLMLLKKTFNVDAIKYCGDENTVISKVAMCGGSGAEFVGAAIASGADIYVTADVKYHDFTSNAHNIMIADIGHYESEQFTKDIFYEIIQKKMPNFATYFAETDNKQVKLYI